MLVARAHAAIDLRIAADGVLILPPADALDELLTDFAAAGAPREREALIAGL